MEVITRVNSKLALSKVWVYFIGLTERSTKEIFQKV
jgi:hypothetical protein